MTFKSFSSWFRPYFSFCLRVVKVKVKFVDFADWITRMFSQLWSFRGNLVQPKKKPNPAVKQMYLTHYQDCYRLYILCDSPLFPWRLLLFKFRLEVMFELDTSKSITFLFLTTLFTQNRNVIMNFNVCFRKLNY